jgi:hypothetical protein
MRTLVWFSVNERVCGNFLSVDPTEVSSSVTSAISLLIRRFGFGRAEFEPEVEGGAVATEAATPRLEFSILVSC